jgi:hypothetical protein
VSGEELERVPIDGARCRHVQVSQVVRQRVAVERAIEGRSGDERLQLGAECDESRLYGDEERLDPEPVSHQREPPGLRVPGRDREHADETAHGGLDPPALEGGENDLRIRPAAEGPSSLLELSA